jgi:hypothetical protein
MINDRSKYDKIREVILNEWDVETLIPAHGEKKKFAAELYG